MRIGIVLYAINNPGGILNHTEQLAQGLRELGHTVDLLSLEWKDKPLKGKVTGGSDESVFGIKFHPYKGWDLTAEMRVPYKGPMLSSAKARLGSYDGLIWTIPCPRKKKETKGDTDWLELYSSCPRNVGIVHDGNLVTYYSNITRTLPWMSGLACVHPCALASTNDLTGNAQLVVNPFAPLETIPGSFNRKPGWYAGQTFKGWKRVDNVIRAARFMTPDLRKVVAGGGIEQCYMVSPDKCKPQYFHEDGVRIWDAAIDNGMDYLGFISGRERDLHLRNLTAAVDPSYSKAYAKLGSHFNRTLIEPMRMGCVPIAEEAVTEHAGWLEAGVHYVGIPLDTGPQEYAAIVEEACRKPEGAVDRDAQRDFLQRFDRKLVAQQYVDMLESPIPGWSWSEAVETKAAKIMEHFAPEPVETSSGPGEIT
tara:strand:- start:40521 stop:41786 length:1266 start_codon:yes stop_codon:yes gene_type:complete